MKHCAIVLVLSLSFASAAAAAAGSVTGHWEGGISVEGQELGIVVDLDRGADGAWKGEIDIPVQGIRNLAIDGVAVDAAAVSFHLSRIPGDPTFKGALSADGNSVSGQMSQSGQSLPFHMTRKGSATLGAKPDDGGIQLVDKGVPGQGIEGEWHGVLATGPSSLRLVLKVKKGADGTLTGVVDSVDQKAMGLPIDKVTFAGGALQFEMGQLGVSYKGTMSADGAKLTGTWSQGGGSAPLEFLRSGR